MNDRARVPFALVGVLLLVGGAGVNATLGGIAPPGDPAAERAVEQATAAARTALDGAVVAAGREAARAPVVAPANTSAGRLLSEEEPFRDYLRLLVYRHARERLAQVGEREGAVTATVTLPQARSIDALGRAKRRVSLARTGPNGTAIRVRIQNVTVTIRRDGRVVDRLAWNATTVAAMPVLAVHERVSRFERRLGAGPTKPGLGRRLTARLYAVAWARGYAQYGGAPIANVLATRHVGLATNGATLALQETTLGASDPTAHRDLRTATARVAARDVLGGAGVDGPLARAALGTASGTLANHTLDERPMAVRVGASADDAFATVLDQGRVTEAARAAYTVDVRLAVRVERVATTHTGRKRPPGEWTLADSRDETRIEVRPAQVGTPDPPGDWHVLRAFGRRVEREHITVRRWQRDDRTVTTRTIRTTVEDVGIAVFGRHAAQFAPERPIENVHHAGTGALDGPNFGDVPERAYAKLVGGRGGPDVVATRAVRGNLRTAPRTVRGASPDDLDEWLYRDLAGLRERVRAVSITVPRGTLGTFEVNPPALLAAEIKRERRALLATPARYDGVADRARIAVRGAYLDAVVAALEARSVGFRDHRSGVADVLESESVSLDRLDDLRRLRHRIGDDRPPTRGLGGPLALSVNATPATLTLRGNGPALATRNVNYFAVPYADAADTVVAAVVGPRRVRLETAARTLRTANRASRKTGDAVGSRGALRRSVRRATERVGDRLGRTLGTAGIGETPRERRAIVAAGVDRWNTTATRALAVSEEAVVPEIVRVAAERHPDALATPRQRDRLALRLRLAVRAALKTPAVRPPQPPTNRTAAAIRTAVTGELAGALGTAGDAARERWGGKVLGSVAAGLPLAPMPGYWYATANVWRVDVRGQYDRFVVRSARGAPTPGAKRFAYVRDGGPVEFDVDGDGTDELLGHARRLSFETTTAVVVVVPPGGRGVGDTDGDTDERSPGWTTM